MFKNRELRIKMVKPQQMETTPASPVLSLTPEQMNEFAKDQVTNAAIAVGTTIIAAMFAHTASEVIVHTAKTKIR
jgi:hypothetical protein